MRHLLPASGILALLLAACDRIDEQPAAPAKTARGEAATSITPTNPSAGKTASMEDITRNDQALAEQIYQLDDEQLPDLLEAVAAKTDPELRATLLTAIYEETSLRPPIIRLPLLLEVARSMDVNPDLRATIMAELGATLNTDHGTSWADWSLAIEEYLADTEGLIRVE
jgi:hypothetical protein